MRYIAMAVTMAAFMLIGLPTKPAEAHSRVYYGYSGGGVSVTIRRAPRYYYAPRSRHYRYYAPRRHYYAPRRSYYHYRQPRPRAYHRAGRSCGHWHNRCVANWGYGANYRGCMRYHRC